MGWTTNLFFASTYDHLLPRGGTKPGPTRAIFAPSAIPSAHSKLRQDVCLVGVTREVSGEKCCGGGDASVAANRHPGQVGYSHSPPQEVRDEESSLRADPGKEGEGQAAHAAACAAHQRQRQADLPFFRGIAVALLHLERAL